MADQKVFTCPYNVLGDHTACMDGMPHQMGVPFVICRAWHERDGYCVRLGRDACRTI